MPKISIITATYNAATTVADCLLSVTSQTYPAEHIIIDGASVDTTLEIIRRISPQAHILCEPDEGIYDAMNKGIALASGDVIGILNADDCYASPNVLEKVARVFEDPSVMSCYGDLVYIKNRRSSHSKSFREKSGRRKGDVLPESTRPPEALPFTVFRYWKSGEFYPKKFYRGWMPPHPTFFVRKSVYDRYGAFNTGIGSAADYELMLRLLLKERISTAYIPEILVRMLIGGASNHSLAARLTANQMDRRAWEVNDLKPYPWTIVMKPFLKIMQYVSRPE